MMSGPTDVLNEGSGVPEWFVRYPDGTLNPATDEALARRWQREAERYPKPMRCVVAVRHHAGGPIVDAPSRSCAEIRAQAVETIVGFAHRNAADDDEFVRVTRALLDLGVSELLIAEATP